MSVASREVQYLDQREGSLAYVYALHVPFVDILSKMVSLSSFKKLRDCIAFCPLHVRYLPKPVS